LLKVGTSLRNKKKQKISQPSLKYRRERILITKKCKILDSNKTLAISYTTKFASLLIQQKQQELKKAESIIEFDYGIASRVYDSTYYARYNQISLIIRCNISTRN
jgi:hypothetical protein